MFKTPKPVDEASRLYEALARKRLAPNAARMNTWRRTFADLRAEVGAERLNATLAWYVANIGKEGVPRCFSAASFCKRFAELERLASPERPAAASSGSALGAATADAEARTPSRQEEDRLDAEEVLGWLEETLGEYTQRYATVVQTSVRRMNKLFYALKVMEQDHSDLRMQVMAECTLHVMLGNPNCFVKMHVAEEVNRRLRASVPLKDIDPKQCAFRTDSKLFLKLGRRNALEWVSETAMFDQMLRRAQRVLA